MQPERSNSSEAALLTALDAALESGQEWSRPTGVEQAQERDSGDDEENQPSTIIDASTGGGVTAGGWRVAGGNVYAAPEGLRPFTEEEREGPPPHPILDTAAPAESSDDGPSPPLSPVSPPVAAPPVAIHTPAKPIPRQVEGQGARGGERVVEVLEASQLPPSTGPMGRSFLECYLTLQFRGHKHRSRVVKKRGADSSRGGGGRVADFGGQTFSFDPEGRGGGAEVHVTLWDRNKLGPDVKVASFRVGLRDLGMQHCKALSQGGTVGLAANAVLTVRIGGDGGDRRSAGDFGLVVSQGTDGGGMRMGGEGGATGGGMAQALKGVLKERFTHVGEAFVFFGVSERNDVEAPQWRDGLGRLGAPGGVTAEGMVRELGGAKGGVDFETFVIGLRWHQLEPFAEELEASYTRAVTNKGKPAPAHNGASGSQVQGFAGAQAAPPAAESRAGGGSKGSPGGEGAGWSEADEWRRRALVAERERDAAQRERDAAERAREEAERAREEVARLAEEEREKAQDLERQLSELTKNFAAKYDPQLVASLRAEALEARRELRQAREINETLSVRVLDLSSRQRQPHAQLLEAGANHHASTPAINGGSGGRIRDAEALLRNVMDSMTRGEDTCQGLYADAARLQVLLR